MDLLSPATSNANNPPYASSKSGSAPPSAGPGRRQRAGARGPAHLTASRPPIERSMRLGAASRNSPPQADLVSSSTLAVGIGTHLLPSLPSIRCCRYHTTTLWQWSSRTAQPSCAVLGDAQVAPGQAVAPLVTGPLT